MFSTTTVPRSDFILSAHGRPTASLTPPGVNGITSRIGRSGYLACAEAAPGASVRAARAARPRVRTSRRFILPTPISVELQSDRFDHRRPERDLFGEPLRRL